MGTANGVVVFPQKDEHAVRIRGFPLELHGLLRVGNKLRAVVLVLNSITGRGYLLAIRAEEKKKGRLVICFRSSQ
jgi:hypothetical protein